MGDRNNRRTNRDYDVGYGKPPRSGQWVKGQSGNPQGSGNEEVPDMLQCVSRALRQKVPVTVNGKRRKITVREALVNKLIAEAASGKPTALRELMKLMDFSGTLERDSEDIVIETQLVLEDPSVEEDRFQRFVRENAQLREELDRLRAQLQARGEAEPAEFSS